MLSFLRRAGFGFLFLPLGLAPAPAAAHPHVWIDYTVTALFAGNDLTALREDWHFDESFSASVLHDIVGPRAGRQAGGFSPEQIRTLHDKAFASLQDYGYFHQVWIDGGPAAAPGGGISAFSARRDGDRLVYSFVYTLAQPVDPARNRIEIGIWDDSYFVAVAPAENPAALRLENPPSAQCRITAAEDRGRPIYFGSVFPQTIRIAC